LVPPPSATTIRLPSALRLLPLERPAPLAALIMERVAHVNDFSVSLEEQGIPD
jgi:hypothetical protein